MWTFDEWALEVRKHLYDAEIEGTDEYELEELFDQGLSPSEALAWFLV